METEKIAQEIIDIKFTAGKSLGKLVKEFYTIMRKYGVKRGTQQYNDAGEKAGVLQNNPEWTLFETLFIMQLKNMLEMEMAFGLAKGYEFPEDLESY